MLSWYMYLLRVAYGLWGDVYASCTFLVTLKYKNTTYYIIVILPLPSISHRMDRILRDESTGRTMIWNGMPMRHRTG